MVLSMAVPGCHHPEAGGEVDPPTIHAQSVRPFPGGARFSKVRDLTFSGRYLWVLDGTPPFLTRLSGEGGEPLLLGRRGQGPLEFLSPWAIQPSGIGGSGGIWVWDFGQQRVVELDSEGGLVRVEPLAEPGRIWARDGFRDVSYANPYRVRVIGSGVLAGRFEGRLDRTADMATGSLVLANRRLDQREEVLPFAREIEQDPSLLREWAALPMWDGCGGGFALWSPRRGEVQWADGAGTILKRLPLNLPNKRLRVGNIERYVGWMARRELGPDNGVSGEDLSRLAASYRHHFADDQP